ncbi:hypothetical protein BsWGS_26158 [Bradybaena similaris]
MYTYIRRNQMQTEKNGLLVDYKIKTAVSHSKMIALLAIVRDSHLKAAVIDETSILTVVVNLQIYLLRGITKDHLLRAITPDKKGYPGTECISPKHMAWTAKTCLR